MMMKLKDVRKSYRQGTQEVPVLYNINLDIQKPGSVALIGPSGSGKSTLLSIAAGLDYPDHGEVWWGEQRVDRLGFVDLTRARAKNVGIIFQQFHLFPHLTALENTELPLRFQDDSEASDKAVLALKRVGLSHRQSHYPHQLSRGECQRVALARVLVSRPRIIFADEPTGSLDQKNAKEVIDQLFDLCQQEEATLVMVTHDLELAARCEERFRLDEGVLQRWEQSP